MGWRTIPYPPSPYTLSEGTRYPIPLPPIPYPRQPDRVVDGTILMGATLRTLTGSSYDPEGSQDENPEGQSENPERVRTPPDLPTVRQAGRQAGGLEIRFLP